MDDFDDWYLEHYGRKPPDYIKTHMRRELVQAVWRLLLDDDFVDAYQNGLVTRFADNVVRLTVPRFFSYSTDYVEKCVHSHLASLYTNKKQSACCLLEASREVPLPTVLD